MSGWASRIWRGPERRVALGLLAAVLLATAVDAGMWVLRHGGAGAATGNSAGRGHAPSPLLTSPYANALLVGAGQQAAYFMFWSAGHGRLQGQISQYLIEPTRLPGQTTPLTATTSDAFTGTVVGSRVTMRLAGAGLGGVTSLTGRIRGGHLLWLSDPVAGRRVIAFRTEHNLDRVSSLFNRMYYGEYSRLNHGRG